MWAKRAFYRLEDPFLTNIAEDCSLIAFVGPNPYYWGTNYEWGNTSYFPQGASTNGYWPVGNAGGQFTNKGPAGELWFGFNDDAVTEAQTITRGGWPGEYRSPGHEVDKRMRSG